MMHVYGLAPVSDDGAYFSGNEATWHPLAEFACHVAPDITASCEDWHTNDDDGLDGDEAEELAVEIENAIADGRAARWVSANASACDLADTDHFIADIGKFAAFLRGCGGFEIS